MQRADWNECRIDVSGIRNPQLLAYYAREHAAGLEPLADCELRVDRVVSVAKGPLYSARLILSLDGTQTSLDETNADAFLAVRDVFGDARLWLEANAPVEKTLAAS